MPDKQTRNLPVKLSEEELRSRSDDLAKVNIDRVDLETKKSARSSEFNREIKEAKLKISQLSQAISSRQEYRDIEIEERRNEETFMVETWRLDGEPEKISERAMTSAERQIQMFPTSTGRSRRRGEAAES